jgi:hypothetical protein
LASSMKYPKICCCFVICTALLHSELGKMPDGKNPLDLSLPQPQRSVLRRNPEDLI